MSAEHASMPQLTDHQRQILNSIAIGRSNEDIANEFGLEKCTVKKLVSTILQKLGAASRAEAASIALRKHLTDVGVG